MRSFHHSADSSQHKPSSPGRRSPAPHLAGRYSFTSIWQDMRVEDQRMLFILGMVGLFIVLLVGALLEQGSERLIVETAGIAERGDGLFDVSRHGLDYGGELAPVFTREVLYWELDILRWAAEHKLDPDMVATVMQIESCGDPEAISHAGAIGLFQVMPFHFQHGENMFDPNTNARRGMNYLAERLVQTRGDAGLAFAGYNGGHVAAAASWDAWSDETRRYFNWSTGIYREAAAGLNSSPTLQNWLEAGGLSLCQQASRRLGLQ